MEMEKKSGLSGSTLKWIAIAAMFIDHVAAALLARLIVTGQGNAPLYGVYLAMRFVGRLGFPIFCFLLVEGFQRTRDRWKYARRLGTFALVSEIPFDLAFNGQVLETAYQNVFFTLLLGLLLLCCLELPDAPKSSRLMGWLLGLFGALLCGLWLETALAERFPGTLFEGKPYVCIGLLGLGVLAAWIAAGRHMGVRMGRLGRNLAFLGIFLMLGDLLRTDYGGMGVLTIAAMYLLRRFPAWEMAGGCAVLSLFNGMELTAFFAVIPAARYNGQRGMKLKYFFYAFYPVHLFLLWLIAFLMGMGQVAVV